MELYSYDYALKALWLYTSEPKWASNWSNCERQPRSTHIMILDHLAFSPKLSARAVAALGGPSKAFCNVLSK